MEIGGGIPADGFRRRRDNVARRSGAYVGASVLTRVVSMVRSVRAGTLLAWSHRVCERPRRKIGRPAQLQRRHGARITDRQQRLTYPIGNVGLPGVCFPEAEVLSMTAHDWTAERANDGESRGKIMPSPVAKSPLDPSVQREIVARPGLPDAQGLYDPSREHDACGVGFVADMHNRKSHDLVKMGLEILLNPRSSRRYRRRPESRRWLRHAAADPARVLPRQGEGERFRPARQGRLRDRRHVPAQGRGGAQRDRGYRRRYRRGAKVHLARLA